MDNYRTLSFGAVLSVISVFAFGLFDLAMAEEFRIGVYHDPITVHHFWNNTDYDSVKAEKIFADMDCSPSKPSGQNWGRN